MRLEIQVEDDEYFLSGPSYIYGGNMSVIHNLSRPESVVRKKSNSVCYHTVHESVAMGEFLVGHIPISKNIADLLINQSPIWAKEKVLISNILYVIHNDH